MDLNNISDRLIIITNENKNKPICIFKILNDDIYITNEIIYNCLVARHKISKSDIPFYIVKSDKSALIFNKIVNQEISSK